MKTENVPEVIEALKREIKIMENLDHINIVCRPATTNKYKIQKCSQKIIPE